jgi:hypothetical protein
LSLRLIEAGARPVHIELAPFSREDSRNYLLALAAAARMPNLFEPEALDRIVDGVGSSPRLLRSTASLAYFFAASAGACEIRTKYAVSALGARIAEGFPKFTKEPVAPDTASESPAGPGDVDEALNPEPSYETPRNAEAVESGELPSDQETASAWQLPSFPQHTDVESPGETYDMTQEGSGRRRVRTVVAGSLIVAAAAVLGWFSPAILKEFGPGSDSVLLNQPAQIDASGLNTVPPPPYGADSASGAAPSAGSDGIPALRNDNFGAADRSGSETVFANPASPVPPAATPDAPPEPAPPPAVTSPKQAAAAPEPVERNSSAKPAIDQTLTAEERAAVARGLRELERNDLR